MKRKLTAKRPARSERNSAQRIKLTERDSRLVIELLENPPLPNAKLRKSARAFLDRP